MIVNRFKIFTDRAQESGASVTEVVLSMAIVAVAAPFLYNQVSTANQTIVDIAFANKIMSMRGPVLNYVRMNQDKWPDVAQIRLAPDELAAISEMPVAAFIDKYAVRGATVTDVYLAFDTADTQLRANRIARHIGTDAAVVGNDGIAYGASWAVSAPDFRTGDLIYRISRDFSGEDKSKYLHRGTSGEDELNVMQRNLNMGGFNIYSIGTIIGDSVKSRNATASFVDGEQITANTVYFSAGANLDGDKVELGNVRVSGDITGFRNIYADVLNGRNYGTNGRVITDRATITKSVNVARDFVLKSSSSKTISGFVGITANSVLTPFISAEEMIFYEKFGLTISGELLVSSTPPLKLGAWSFPTTTPPSFNELTVLRADMPRPINTRDFRAIMQSGWKSAIPQQTIGADPNIIQ